MAHIMSNNWEISIFKGRQLTQEITMFVTPYVMPRTKFEKLHLGLSSHTFFHVFDKSNNKLISFHFEGHLIFLLILLISRGDNSVIKAVFQMTLNLIFNTAIVIIDTSNGKNHVLQSLLVRIKYIFRSKTAFYRIL